VRWQKWRLRVGFNAREGLVLHAIGYEDGGRLRPVLHRTALSEMVVPYGHPGGGHFRKNAFDVGEYGIGVLANSLTLGCDCLGAIRYFDAWLSDSKGEPYCIEKAVCLHEEDFGILWKHTDLFTGEVDVRRARRLVVSSISTVGNYEYGLFWYFHQDGSIHFEIKATGILNTSGLKPGEKPTHGTIVSPGVYAHYHQHIFNVRLDVAIDGERNRVVEVDTVALPVGPDNPHGNAFTIRESVLKSEQAAQRNVDFNAARFWKIESADSRNGLGQRTAYKLLPLSPVPMFSSPQSSVAKRAAFMSRQLWVTAYHPDELHAAGRYPNQSAGGDGLPAWTAADRPLVDTDLVVWHSFGLHHIPRPEDFPVQPVTTSGFALHPAGFFDENPALDVPPIKSGKSCCVD
jgi:primary-amine oxidase